MLLAAPITGIRFHGKAGTLAINSMDLLEYIDPNLVDSIAYGFTRKGPLRSELRSQEFSQAADWFPSEALH